jgi:hypothetical protein
MKAKSPKVSSKKKSKTSGTAAKKKSTGKKK